MFQDEFGDCANHLKRNLDQYQTAGKADIEFHNLMIEAKRYASGHWYKPEWWEQAKTSAGDTHIPSADIQVRQATNQNGIPIMDYEGLLNEAR